MVELEEDVEGYPTTGRDHAVIGLVKHVLERVEGHVMTQHSVGQLVHLQQAHQLLGEGEGRYGTL